MARTQVSAVLSGCVAALVDTGGAVKVDAARQVGFVRRVGFRKYESARAVDVYVWSFSNDFSMWEASPGRTI